MSFCTQNQYLVTKRLCTVLAHFSVSPSLQNLALHFLGDKERGIGNCSTQWPFCSAASGPGLQVCSTPGLCQSLRATRVCHTHIIFRAPQLDRIYQLWSKSVSPCLEQCSSAQVGFDTSPLAKRGGHSHNPTCTETCPDAQTSVIQPVYTLFLQYQYLTL